MDFETGSLINTFNTGLAYEIEAYEASGNYEGFFTVVAHLKNDLFGFIKNYEFWMGHSNISKLQRGILKEFGAAINKARFLVKEIDCYLIKH